MARPKQDGLLYFSFDTDFFYADRRIKRLHYKFGNGGLIFYIYLLTEVYRNGYYIRWDKENVEDAACELGLTEGFIEQVLTFLVSRSLLTKSTLANSDTVITSPGIQKRYQEAVKGRKRDIFVDAEIWLLKEEETVNCIKVTLNGSKSEKNHDKSEKNLIKESKENKGKEKENRESVCRLEDFIAEYPKGCNRHLTAPAYISLIIDGIETEDKLVVCARNYAEACRIEGTKERYIKNAENFLKDRAFEKYLPGRYKKPNVTTGNQFNQFKQHDYDFEAIEKAIMKGKRGNGGD